MSDASRDGRYLIYTKFDPGTPSDIWYLPWSDHPDWSEEVAFLATGELESSGQLSPDGRWIAYNSSGRVYIRPFPSGAGIWEVTPDGGAQPRWSADASELFFTRIVTAPERPVVYSVSVESDGTGGLAIGAPQPLFEFRAQAVVPRGNIWGYAPHPDGQRFIVNAFVNPSEPTIHVITNWRPEPGE